MSNTPAVGFTSAMPLGQSVNNEPVIEWAWIDTCCIDKSSSSELSEAINSMWAWYRSAEFCVAYLSDVQQFSERRSSYDEVQGSSPKASKQGNDNGEEESNDPDSEIDNLNTEVHHSEWFTRGWVSDLPFQYTSIAGSPQQCEGLALR